MKTKRTLSGLAIMSLAAALSAGTAYAAAIERAVPATSRILFEDGRYIEFGLSYADPDQSGDDATIPVLLGGPAAFTGNTGDLFEESFSLSAAYKADLTDQLSYAILFDQPFGADTNYGAGTFPGAPSFSYDGTIADLNTYQITGVVAYDVTPQIKVYGGVRAQRLDAEAAIPFIGPSGGLPGYTIDASEDWGYGYLLGAAYSRPEIALRVALTYYSAIEHDLDTTEFGGIPIPGVQAAGATQTDIETPQSVTLDFQTGVAPKTLVFGSVRWVDWSEFAIEPPSYVAVTGGRPLVDYNDDWWTYTAGVGQRFTDQLAGSLSVSYEPDVGGELTTLGPYDGRTTVTAALSYDVNESLNVSGGLTYGRLGDTFNVLQTDYNDGSVWGAGLRVGYTF